MLKQFYCLICVVFFTFTAFSQKTLPLQDQTLLPATENWTFIIDSYNYSGYLNMQIANNGKGGTIKLEIKTSDKNFYIGGNVYLFLEDGNVITCTDKNKRSISDEAVQSYYILTPNEINLLKKQKITDIHFKIVGNETRFSSKTGHFTAQNIIRTYGFPNKSIDTVTEISQLFKK